MNGVMRTSLTALLCATLAACGGGGGGDDSGGNPPGNPNPPGLSISFSGDQFTFTADGPWVTMPTPASHTLTATLNGTATGTLFIVVLIETPGLVNVTNVLVTGPTTGQATIEPLPPGPIGAGAHTATIRILACLNDPNCTSGLIAGTPKTITVRYNVTSHIELETVMPHVVPSNVLSGVILRGNQFPFGATVEFGSTASPAVARVSNTELRATVPAMPAGTYPVTVNSGNTSFTGTDRNLKRVRRVRTSIRTTGMTPNRVRAEPEK